MIRLSLRQLRAQLSLAVLALLVIAAFLIATRPHLVDLYRHYAEDQQRCFSSQTCSGVSIDTGTLIHLLELLGTALVGVPVLLGAFWGAPLIAREFEHGTHRLAWTQSVSRGRWLISKLLVVGLASALATGILSALISWWSSPLDRARGNRFGVGMFAERNLAPVGYAAFAFVLGVALGLVLRRTLTAMTATLAVFMAVRIGFSYGVRPQLIAPKRLSQALDPDSMGFGSVNNGPATLMPNAPSLPDAWIYSTRIVDAQGHELSSQTVSKTCPSLGELGRQIQDVTQSGSTGRIPAPPDHPLQTCVIKLSASYHQVTTYQPANRYWTFQWLETSIFLAAALALGWFCFWWIRRRAN